MAGKTFLAIGECMIEMARDPSGLWRMGFAGDTFNTAWYFRKATAKRDWQVDYFTRLGDDVHSQHMIAFMAESGIGVSRIARDATRQPGLYLIDLENGERSFTYWRGQSAARLLADDEAALRDAIDAADIVYFSGITLAILAPERRQVLLRCIAEARRNGRQTVFDPNIRPRLWESAETMRETIMQAASLATVALPSFDDERATFGDATPEICARRYGAAGCAEVVVKNAGNAICVLAGGATATVADLARVEPVDTTGAGDSFNGAYLAYRAAGDEAAQAVRRAHQVSSRVVLCHGALVDVAQSRPPA